MDDQAVIDRLRSDLRAERDATASPDGLVEAGRQRWHRRRARRTAAGAVAAALVLVGMGVLALGRGDDQGSVDTGPADPGLAETTTTVPRWTTTPHTGSTSSTTQPLPTGPASQTPEEAERDGVIPELAALPVAARDLVTASITVPEGEWVIADPTEHLLNLSDPNTCLFGDPSGTPGVDSVCTSDYAEVLLLDREGQIERAYPMAGVNPSWIHVTDGAVYGGRVGDGAQPHSTVFRIDRTTLQLRGLVFPAPDASPGIPGQDGFLVTTAAGWRVATDEERSSTLVTTGDDAVGTEVTSVIGPIGVDLARIEALFADR